MRHRRVLNRTNKAGHRNVIMLCVPGQGKTAVLTKSIENIFYDPSALKKRCA